jgi:sn-glycerol 3-phosphate transport system substrate-binding protein
MKRRNALLLLAVAAFMLIGMAMAQTKIDFWEAFTDQPRNGWLKDRASEWNAKHSDYQIVVTPKGSYSDTLNAAVLAARQGNPPTIVQIFDIGTREAFDSGLFEPISQVPGKFDTSDYIKPVLSYYTINGQLDSMPFNSSNAVMFVNQSLMKKAGLDPNKPPETFSEVIKDCKALRAAGDKSDGCMGFSLNGWFYEQWMAESNAPIFNNDNGRSARATKALLTSDASKKIVNWIKELNDNGNYTYTGKLEDWNGSEAIFNQGKSMFHIDSTSEVGAITKAAKDAGFDMTAAKLPIPDGAPREGVVVGGASVWLMKGHPTAELQAARNFILYMTNTENMISWSKLTGYFPVRESSLKQMRESGWLDSHPNFDVAVQQLLNTKDTTATSGGSAGPMPKIRHIVELAIQKVLSGTSVDSALQTAEGLANHQLEQYNSNFKK